MKRQKRDIRQALPADPASFAPTTIALYAMNGFADGGRAALISGMDTPESPEFKKLHWLN